MIDIHFYEIGNKMMYLVTRKRFYSAKTREFERVGGRSNGKGRKRKSQNLDPRKIRPCQNEHPKSKKPISIQMVAGK